MCCGNGVNACSTVPQCSHPHSEGFFIQCLVSWHVWFVGADFPELGVVELGCPLDEPHLFCFTALVGDFYLVAWFSVVAYLDAPFTGLQFVPCC